MKLKTLLIAVIMCLSSLFNIGGDKTLNSNSTGVFTSSREEVGIFNNSYFRIGDINLHFDPNSEYLASQFTIKFAQTYWEPEMDINVSYVNKNYNVIYVYRHFNCKNEMDKDFGAFFGQIKIPVISLGDSTKITVDVALLNPRVNCKFSFNLTNPNRTVYIYDEPIKIYTSFVKSLSSDLGYNYYKAFKLNKLGSENMYYYSHFDVNKQLNLLTNDAYCIQNAFLYVYDIKSTLFYNSTFTLPGYGNFYRFFNLLARQDIQTGIYSFKLAKDYYFDPVTNIMYTEKNNDNLLTANQIYFPIKHYMDFQETRLGIILECNVNSIIYKIRYDFKISFQENYYKDEVVVYKEIKKTTKDETMEEITI